MKNSKTGIFEFFIRTNFTDMNDRLSSSFIGLHDENFKDWHLRIFHLDDFFRYIYKLSIIIIIIYRSTLGKIQRLVSLNFLFGQLLQI